MKVTLVTPEPVPVRQDVQITLSREDALCLKMLTNNISSTLNSQRTEFPVNADVALFRYALWIRLNEAQVNVS